MFCSISIGSARRSLVAVLTLSGVLLAGCSKPLPPLPPEPPPPVKEEPPPPPPAKAEEPPPPPPPEPLKLPAPVMFASGTAKLADESDAALKYVVEYLSKSPEVRAMRIEGHTDSRGNPLANQKLSEERASAVARWLVDHGVDCKRVVPLGFGDSDPVADNGTEDGRAQNRRTVFVDQRSNRSGGRPATDPCAK
ncbi:Outer membrane protein [Minicystis rosea]|nr:Outer membrane protein [Minicystis rosea]